MSNTIDQHIVGLDFDTTKFDRGIEGASKQLNNFQNSLGKTDSGNVFSKLEKAASSIMAKMGPLGEAASQSFSKISAAASSVVSDVVSKFSSIANVAKLTFAGISSGVVGLAAAGGIKRAMNIEQAKFQLKGLGADVDAVMANVNEAVTGTAYGLDQAAVVASQLTASGIQAGDQMTAILKGIAGVASMTGRDFGEVGHIFTTVAGQGKLMTMQLRQLEYSGINAAATMAKAWGKTEEEVRDMVTKGEVSFEMFSNAMNDAFGEHAQAANELFSGSLSNVKAALSRIGERFATPGLEHLRDILNSLRPVINDVNKLLNSVVDLFVKWSGIGSNAIIDFLKNLDGQLQNLNRTGTSLSALSGLLDNLFGLLSNWKPFWAEMLSPEFFDLGYWDFVVRNAITGIDGLVSSIKKLFEKIPAPPDNLKDTLAMMSGLESEAHAFTMDSLVKKNPELKQAMDYAGGLAQEVSGLLSISEEKTRGLNDYNDMLTGVNQSLAMMSELENETGQSTFSELLENFPALKPSVGMMQSLAEESGGVVEAFKELEKLSPWDLFHFPDQVSPEAMQQSMDMMDGLAQEANEMYPALTAEGFAGKIAKLSLDFRNWAENIHFTDEQIAAFQGTISRIKGVIHGFGTILSGIFDGAVSALGPFFDWLVTKVLPDSASKFVNLFDKLSDGLPTAEKIADFFRQGGKGIGDFFTALKNGETIKLPAIVENIKNFITPIIEMAKNSGILNTVIESLKNLFGFLTGQSGAGNLPFADIFHSITQFFRDLPGTVLDGAGKVINAIGTFFNNLGITIGDVIGLINGLLTIVMIRDLRTSLDGVKETFKSIGSFLTSWLPEDLSNAAKIFEKVGGSVSKFFDGLKKSLDNVAKNMMPDNLLKIAAAIGILALSLLLLSTINPEKLAVSLAAIGVLAAGLVKVMTTIVDTFEQWDARKMSALSRVLTAMIALAGSLLIVSLAIKLLSTIDPMQMAVGIMGVGAAMLIMCEALNMISEMVKDAPFLKAAFAMAGMATSLLVLVAVIEILGHTNPMKLAQGLVAVAITLGMLIGSLKLIDKYINGKSLLVASAALMGLATTLLVMTAAIVVLGSIGWDNLAAGLFGIAGSLLILGIALEAMAHIKIEVGDLAKVIVLLAALSVVMVELAAVCAVFASMGLNGVGTALLGLAGSLAVMLGAVAAFGAIGKYMDVEDVLKASAAVMIMSTAMVILSAALANLGGLGENIGYSLVGLAGGLLMLGIAMAAMKNGVAGAAAMLIAAAAVAVLAPALISLSQVPFMSLIPSLIAVAVAIGLFAGMAKLIASALPAMVAIGMVFSELGIGALGFAVAIGIVTFTLVEFGDKGVQALIKIATYASEMVVALTEIFTAIGVALLSSLEQLIPQLMAVGVAIVSSLLSAMETLVPQFILTGISIVSQLMIGLAQAAPTLATLGFQMIIAFINGLANTIREQHMAMYEAGKNLFMAILEALADCFNQIGSDLMGFISDLPAILSGEKPLFADAGTGLGESVVDNAGASLDQLPAVGEGAINQFLSSVGGQIDGASLQFDGIPEAAQLSMDQLPAIGESGASGLLSGFTSGLEGVDGGSVAGNFLSGFSAADFSGAGQQKAAELVAAFQDTSGISTAGTEQGNTLVSSFDTGAQEMSEKASARTSEAVSAVGSYQGAAHGAGSGVGSNFGAGMSAGIGAWIGPVAEKARQMVKAAKSAADSEAKSASPSKEMIKRGKWFGQGFERGIDSMIAPVSRKASDMVSTALDEVERYSLGTQSVGGIDWDIAPIIRPVLDLSEVEVGMAQLDSILQGYEAYPLGAYGRPIGATAGSVNASGISKGPIYNLYIDGAIVNSTPEIQRVIYDTFEVVSMYGGMNHGD